MALTLREKRVAKGWTQEYLSQRLGISVATVQRWEAGKHAPSPMALKLLKKILG